MPEPIAPPPVDMERGGFTILERVRALETRADGHDVAIRLMAETFSKFDVEFDKVKVRLAMATGAIIAISVVLKLVPPEVGEMLKHLLAG